MHINLHFDCVVSPRPDNWRKITILLRHQSSSPLPLFPTLPLNKSVEMGVEVTESETISSARLHHITWPGGGDHCKVLCLRNFSPVFEGVCSQAPSTHIHLYTYLFVGVLLHNPLCNTMDPSIPVHTCVCFVRV